MGQKKRKHKSSKNEVNCLFCGKNEDNEFLYGKFYRTKELSVHQNCMFFSSGLAQRGSKDSEGILGFLPEDIKREWARGQKLQCFYCKEYGATLGCVLNNCKRSFHFPCGVKNHALNQHFGNFSSYCHSHKLKQKPVKVKEEPYCYICCAELNRDELKECLYSPCCKKNFFHRLCLQTYAISAGLHFLKCPLCNNSSEFIEEMQTYGICIPDKDASWELESNAFGELLYRPDCGALECGCQRGRKYDGKGSWCLLPCVTCGADSRHKQCGGLSKSENVWQCDDCKAFEISKKEENDVRPTVENTDVCLTVENTDVCPTVENNDVCLTVENNDVCLTVENNANHEPIEASSLFVAKDEASSPMDVTSVEDQSISSLVKKLSIDNGRSESDENLIKDNTVSCLDQEKNTTVESDKFIYEEGSKSKNQNATKTDNKVKVMSRQESSLNVNLKPRRCKSRFVSDSKSVEAVPLKSKEKFPQEGEKSNFDQSTNLLENTDTILVCDTLSENNAQVSTLSTSSHQLNSLNGEMKKDKDVITDVNCDIKNKTVCGQRKKHGLKVHNEIQQGRQSKLAQTILGNNNSLKRDASKNPVSLKKKRRKISQSCCPGNCIKKYFGIKCENCETK